MILVAITTPKVTDDDAAIIVRLLNSGIDIIHLRKPESTIEECRRVLERLDARYRSKIVVHDYPALYAEFSLKGIHLNRNITSYSDDYRGNRSRSCHTLGEVVRYKADYDYLLLSPIFDSISKQGYRSGFSDEELRRASDEGIIDHKVIALGGVTPERFDYIRSLNFGGVAMMGSIYK